MRGVAESTAPEHVRQYKLRNSEITHRGRNGALLEEIAGTKGMNPHVRLVQIQKLPLIWLGAL